MRDDSTHICAEIQYDSPDGMVHSDLCTNQFDSSDWRQLLHQSLDEWLDHSHGTGHFTVGNLDEEED